jgi:hypothetical protein
MGMAADIIAIGPFSLAVVACLEYPPEHYKGTREGSPVIAQLFGITHGSSASREFARCLGITDPWDFNQHKINPLAIKREPLRAFFSSLHDGDDFLRDLERLLVMRDEGFEFYFRPNG